MSFNRFFSASMIVAVSLFFFTLNAALFAQTESTLYFFTGGADGGQPYGNLIFDNAGNLYGTTSVGGTHQQGTVFELSPLAGGGWMDTTLYSFGSGNNQNDGQIPFGGLVFDSVGNLFGTTSSGGVYGLGTVFEVLPVAGGGWSEHVIYSFAGGLDVGSPAGGLVFDASGNLFGYSSAYGPNSLGGIFELSPSSGGNWAEKVILAGSFTYGGGFLGSLAFDNRGNLYAAAGYGGVKNAGSVYRLTPNGDGWKSTVIYTFTGKSGDGWEPVGGLTFRSPNHLYGVTAAGGRYLYGTVFELTLGSTGGWEESILYSFGANTNGPLGPEASLTVGPAGQLYGTTDFGGNSHSGAAYVLLESGGTWKEKTLHYFSNSDTGTPAGSLILNSSGNLYGLGHTGTTVNGGVYEIVP